MMAEQHFDREGLSGARRPVAVDGFQSGSPCQPDSAVLAAAPVAGRKPQAFDQRQAGASRLLRLRDGHGRSVRSAGIWRIAVRLEGARAGQ